MVSAKALILILVITGSKVFARNKTKDESDSRKNQSTALTTHPTGTEESDPTGMIQTTATGTPYPTVTDNSSSNSSISNNNSTIDCGISNSSSSLNNSNNSSSINNSSTPADQSDFCLKALFDRVLETIKEEPGIILLAAGILIGILFSVLLRCLVKTCRRSKKRKSSYPVEEVEMATPIFQQSDGEKKVHEGEELANGDVAPKEPEYSNIVFSGMKARDPVKVLASSETEYAEIKIDKVKEKQEEAEQDEETVEEAEKEEVEEEQEDENEAMLKENNEETLSMRAAGEAADDEVLYSNVEDIPDETVMN